jgi:hypothetical protein
MTSRRWITGRNCLIVWEKEKPVEVEKSCKVAQVDVKSDK